MNIYYNQSVNQSRLVGAEGIFIMDNQQEGLGYYFSIIAHDHLHKKGVIDTRTR